MRPKRHATPNQPPIIIDRLVFEEVIGKVAILFLSTVAILTLIMVGS